MATRGQVKWFDPKKGFGFILGPDNQDVFVHYTKIRGEGFRSLRDGEMVDYELVEGDKGWQAQEVDPVPSTSEEENPTGHGYSGRSTEEPEDGPDLPTETTEG